MLLRVAFLSGTVFGLPFAFKRLLVYDVQSVLLINPTLSRLAFELG